MKKFYSLTFLFATAMVITSIVLLTSFNYKNTKQKNINTNSSYITSENKFIQNSTIKHLLNSYSKNENEQQDYYHSQFNLQFNQEQQLKYSLIWSDPIRSTQEYKDSQRKTRTDASNNILNTLNKNWFWYLYNINKMQFLFNPYGRYTTTYQNEKEDFLKQKEDNKSFLQQISDNEIQKVYFVKLQQYNGDIYKNKYVYYLSYKNNLYIKVYKLTKPDHTVEIMVWPDLYQIKTNKNLQNLFTEWENKIMQKRIASIEGFIAKNSRYSADYFYNFYSDHYLLQYSLSGFYYDLIRDSIKELNQQNNLQITRYTLRGIDA